MKKQPERPVLITDAARSQDDQLRSRQVRYVTMMGIRALCLIVGAVLISAKVPLLPLWLSLCAVAMVALPWAAVLIANDRPPKKRTKAAEPAPAAAQRSLTPEEADARGARTIDAD